VPAFKLWFSTNHKPTIRGTDMAIWDRIRLVPFLVRIPAEDQDKKLREKLIAEAPGILAWAVAGCLEWQRDGLNEPDQVLTATRDYRSEMDVLGEFIGDRCVVDPAAQVTSKDLYRAYTFWCEQAGEKPLSQILIGKKLGDRGFESALVGPQRTRTWLGIGLRLN
jgi:putative DNA primase/helicase